MCADAVELRQYGWFWECPNGGDKCQYRHALPEGFVLKRVKKEEGAIKVEEGPTIEDELEEKRKVLTTRTPVTFERLQAWLEKKKADKLAREEADLEKAKKDYAKGKMRAGVSGRMLFSIDSSLFVDDGEGSDGVAACGSDAEAMAICGVAHSWEACARTCGLQGRSKATAV